MAYNADHLENSSNRSCTTEQTTKIGNVAHEEFAKDFSQYSPTDTLKRLYRNQFLSDFEIVLKKNGETYPTHRLILAMTSPVFAKMMKDRSLKKCCCDYEPDAFEWFLQHAYHSKTGFSQNFKLLLEVYKLLHELEMQKVLDKLREHLTSILTEDKVDAVYDIALEYSDRHLQTKCHEFITENCLSILKSADNGKVSRKVLQLALSHDDVNIPEIELFKSVIEWAKHNAESSGQGVREMLDTILAEIDFLSMDLDDLMNLVSEKEIFSEAELRAIILLNQEVETKPNVKEYNISSDYPSDLSRVPKRRWRRNKQVFDGGLKSCQIALNLKCSHRNLWGPAVGTEFAILQVSSDILLYKIKARCECYVGNTALEVVNNDVIKGRSMYGPPWQFGDPVALRKNESYKLLLTGPGKLIKHESRMFSMKCSDTEFCGRCIMCDINIGFKYERCQVNGSS